MKEISMSGSALASHLATASISFEVTFRPSSWRRRFSSRIFIE
jgi:hypothetical protein